MLLVRGCALVVALVVAVVASPPAAGSGPPALVGKWHVHATLLSRVHLEPLRKPDRTWIFRRACGNGHCVKRLLFEL
jgi:hypothetical protein